MCIFCNKLQENIDIIYQNESVYVIYDGFPVSEGHMLIITKRHIENYFETNIQEVKNIDSAIKHMKTRLDELYHPDGYNIGINNGVAAGQSVMHLHIHLIPRYENDCLNPKGGVRGVKPGKRFY
ncbi:HIT family protein [Mycoplasmatota bacterium WC30]